VFQFTKMAGNPSGVILQPTGQTAAANEILTATFQLGNNSAERRRVTVILHDNNFSDLSACTFWLAPGQPLSDYTYRTFATQPWGNITLSVYPATVGTIGVHPLLLDNVTLRRTPSAVISGTECLEPGSSVVQQSAKAGVPISGLRRQLAATRATAPKPADRSGALAGTAGGALAPPRSGAAFAADPDWTVDLTTSSSAQLLLDSWLTGSSARASVQVSTDGVTWDTVHLAEASDTWRPEAIDLGAYAGSTIRVRFVLDELGPALGEIRDVWFVRAVRLRVRF
jgi:hypothetical protein